MSFNQFNYDNLSRLLSEVGGIGVDEYDPLRTTFIRPTPVYTREQLINAYRNIWACRKVCDFLPAVMARGWGKIEIRSNVELENRLNKSLKKLRTTYQNGQRLANLYGGAIVVRVIDDNRDYREPIGRDFNTIAYSRVYNPWEIYPYIKTGNEDLINPEYYQMAASFNDGHKNIIIHRDRILRFRGVNSDNESMRLNRGFEDSVLIGFLEPCLRYLTAISYVGASVTSFEFIVHKLQNLFNELQNDESQEHLKERLQVAHMSLSALRGMVVDKEEEDVQVINRTYTGVTEILETLRDEMIAASGLTKPQFSQEHPSGLAATGESERLAEADVIRALQIEKWEEQIEKDCELHLKQAKFFGANWEWKWSNLFQQTPIEEGTLLEKQANADKIRIESGVVTAQEIRKLRFNDLGEQF